MNWKGYGRKQSWPSLRYYPSIFVEELRKTTNPQAGYPVKMAVFWVVAPCSLILPDYTVLLPRRQPSSYSPP
jgi:hypothetical protein